MYVGLITFAVGNLLFGPTLALELFAAQEQASLSVTLFLCLGRLHRVVGGLQAEVHRDRHRLRRDDSARGRGLQHDGDFCLWTHTPPRGSGRVTASRHDHLDSERCADDRSTGLRRRLFFGAAAEGSFSADTGGQ
jgi:hypothetical protein